MANALPAARRRPERQRSCKHKGKRDALSGAKVENKGKQPAPGAPGIQPRWTRGAKDAVGTAYSTSSKLWYTLASGCITEVYYPTIDSPQIRDLQYLVTDGATFLHDERRHMATDLDCVSEAALGFQVTNRDPQQRYILKETVLGDPHQSCLLVHTIFSPRPDLEHSLRLYLLCAPHLEIGGWHNNAEVRTAKGRTILVAQKGGTWLALAATVPFSNASCGFVGVSDGWTDLASNYVMDWQYDLAADGNVALTGELDLSRSQTFTLGLAFGTSLHDAVSCLLQALSRPFQESLCAFRNQWQRTAKRFGLMQKLKCADSRLFERSVNLLLAHEDKSYPGAMIASLSIPWGEDKGDEELGGYHLVWTRDLVQCATALLAVGDIRTPLRALIYLAVSQKENGGFHQNSWIDGRPYWNGAQLDEVSFPIILAWRLRQQQALQNFDPYPMVVSACKYIVLHGPRTQQGRWEEAGGYSPYTLAANIAALVCAAEFMDERDHRATAEFVREYADFLESHIDRWTVTASGTLVPGVRHHFIRINPAAGAEVGDEDLDSAWLTLANEAPGCKFTYPAKEIVDAGFLQLVRYGIRRADDPTIEESLAVIDAMLKVDTPFGPVWRRYNHDGYGQAADGTSYRGSGQGRAWPLLTGERGHYELAAGRDPRPFLRAMEGSTTGIGLIPEQIWDAADVHDRLLRFGGPTGSAIPLLWAHAEYIKLLRSAADGQVFDWLPPVGERYTSADKRSNSPEIWKFNRRVGSIPAGTRLRIIADERFVLHWSPDEWKQVRDTESQPTALGIEYVDLLTRIDDRAPLRFTFYWPKAARWEGQDYVVALRNQ